MKTNEIGFFIAGFIGGPIFLNISPGVANFFYWFGVASATLFGACGLALALGYLSLNEDDENG